MISCVVCAPTLQHINSVRKKIYNWRHIWANGIHVKPCVTLLDLQHWYWIFENILSRKRFFQLCFNLHIAENIDRTKGKPDIFYKVRLLYDAIRNSCHWRKILWSDEQMVPLRGTLAIKQCVKGKPDTPLPTISSSTRETELPLKIKR